MYKINSKNIKNVLSNLFRSEFLKNVSFQMLGVGIAQVLPLLATLILTRLYTEQDFAGYTAFFAVGSIFAVGAGARYQYAIMIPKRNSEAIKVFSLSIYITILYSVILIFVVGILAKLGIDFKLGTNIFLIPIYVMFFGIWNAFSNLSIRYKTFKHNSFSKVLQSIFYILISVLLGMFKPLLNGLVLAKMMGVLTSSIYLFKKSVINWRFPKSNSFKSVAIKYIDYPKYGLIPAFLDIASVQGIVLILTWFYSKENLGYLGLTLLILSAPLSLVGTSFKEVFYQKITFIINAKEFNKSIHFFKRSALGLLCVGIPICIIVSIWGEALFSFAFGANWKMSGVYASVLSFSFLVQLVVSPLSSIFNATNKLKVASYWQILYFITTFSTLGISAFILKLEVINLLYVYVIHEIILYIFYFILQYKTLKNLI